MNPLKERAARRDADRRFLPGHRLCAGCAAPIVVKLVLMAAQELGIKPIIVNATSCLEVASTIYPYTSRKIPRVHNAFENAGATASGVEAALRVLKRKYGRDLDDVKVIVFAGDGGTYDIGFQSLSGMLERGHDVLYVLYDNEAYMNTGIQRSGATPLGARTTTSPAGRKIPGNPRQKKPISFIVAAHGIPYVATSTPAHFLDLFNKAKKALQIEGPKFLHVLSTCPRGRRLPTEKSIENLKLAVDTCYFPLREYENGTRRLTDRSLLIAKKPELKKPVEERIKQQGRFRHLLRPENKHILEELQRRVDRNREYLLKLTGFK